MKSPGRNFQGRDEAPEFTAGISSLSDAITPVGTEIWVRAPPPRAVSEREGGSERKDTAERLLEARYSPLGGSLAMIVADWAARLQRYESGSHWPQKEILLKEVWR